MAKKEPLYPHVPKSQMREGPPPSEIKPTEAREYTPPELAEIAKIFYEAQASQRITIYAGLRPLYTTWGDLTQSQRDEAIRGLQERIEREGLMGYLDRKRPWGQVEDVLTEGIISELKREGYL